MTTHGLGHTTVKSAVESVQTYHESERVVDRPQLLNGHATNTLTDPSYVDGRELLDQDLRRFVVYRDDRSKVCLKSAR